MAKTITVIRTALFRITGPAGETLGPPPHGVLELVFHAWEPVQIQMVFRAYGDPKTEWVVSRDMFAAAVRNPNRPNTVGDCQLWHSPDGRGLVITLKGDTHSSACEILLEAARVFCDEIDAASPVADEDEAMAELIEQALAELFPNGEDGEGC